MKKSTVKILTKIFALVLVLAMVIGFLAMIPARATDNPTIEILSNNVYYGETLNLMYGIHTENAGDYTTKLTLYTDAACENKLCDAVVLKDENGDAITFEKNEKTCVAYVSKEGVAAQNMAIVVYAKAQLMDGENVVASSNVQRYSVLEYVHERMMSGVSDAYVTMYKNLITYAASAQVALPDTTTTASVNSFSYVRVENGTLDGTYNAGMLPVDTKLETIATNLEAGSGYKVEWTVKEYDYNAVTNTKVLTTDEVKELQVEAGVNLYLVANVVEDTSELPTKEVVFAMGGDGDATHSDGSSDTAQYSETVDGYTMTLTGGSKMYPKSRDAAGNGCIKLGTGDTAGTFTLTVASDVSKVIISVAGYKGNAAKISINGGEVQIISTLSNNGAYTDIEIDTSDNKTITFTTASGGYRAMINTIKFVVPDRSNPGETEPDATEPGEPECQHTNTTVNGAAAATCTTAGSTGTTVCDDCGETIKEATVIPVIEHTYVEGICTVCGAEDPDYVPEGGDEPAEPTTVSVTIGDQGWTNSTKYTELKLDGNITARVTGGSNTGKYYSSDKTWRIYQNESPSLTITAGEGYTIKTVKITYLISNKGTLKLNGSNINTDAVVTVDAASITFSVGNTGTATNGQVKITAIEVVYESATKASSLFANEIATPFFRKEWL